MDSKMTQHRKIHIKESVIDGHGIFAKRNIKKHEGIAIIKGNIINHTVIDQATSDVGQNWIGFGKNKWINSKMFDQINHSCDPNAGIKGSKTVVALRNIKKGEEILIDYSITEEDILWTLGRKCRCGSKKCRSVIKSIQFLSKRVFDNYMPYIPQYFQKVYMKYHKGRGK